MGPVEPPGNPGYNDSPVFGPETQEAEDTNMDDTENWEGNEPEYSQLGVFQEQLKEEAKDTDTDNDNESTG